jgi:hypothetical protein
MRVIRVTIDRRAEGIRVELAMSPSVLDDLVEDFYDVGSVRFNADDDLAIELDIEVGELNPEEEPQDLPARVEFVRDPEEYEPLADDEE